MDYINRCGNKKVEYFTLMPKISNRKLMFKYKGEVTAQEEQLWQFVVANYGTSVFSTKQLEKDYGNAAYATIRAFMLKFEELGLLRTQIFSNRVKYMW